MKKLTLQSYLAEQWQDIAELHFNAKTDELVKISYLNEHTISHFSEDGATAFSLNFPVDFFLEQPQNSWAFLQDIIPAGASRRYWLKALDIEHLSPSQQQFLLLQQATIAPIGNLRIKEAVPSNESSPRLFSTQEVINRRSDFLEYANQRGAMVGGATGAGGEAPKLLLRHYQGKVWIDNQQLGQDQGDYYLVKYPRGIYSPIDCDILRAEYAYYHELTAMGFSTISTSKMKLEEGEKYPSLWLPRFDLEQNEDGKIIKRYAVESVYSILNKNGGLLDHYQTLENVIKKITESQLVKNGFQFNIEEFVIEWVKRDLLNIAFGNSDNHGRNTAFLRDEKGIYLAPIYDFAPMRADPEGIIRSTTWEKTLELGGEYQFEQIIEKLAKWVEPDRLWQELHQLALNLTDLKNRLAQRGVPESILNYPAIGFDYLPEKLQRWGLLK